MVTVKLHTTTPSPLPETSETFGSAGGHAAGDNAVLKPQQKLQHQNCNRTCTPYMLRFLVMHGFAVCDTRAPVKMTQMSQKTFCRYLLIPICTIAAATG